MLFSTYLPSIQKLSYYIDIRLSQSANDNLYKLQQQASFIDIEKLQSWIEF